MTPIWPVISTTISSYMVVDMAMAVGHLAADMIFGYDKSWIWTAGNRGSIFSLYRCMFWMMAFWNTTVASNLCLLANTPK